MRLVTLLLVLVSTSVFSQDIYTLSGRILSNNNPVPFAAIAVENSSKGTQSDIDGRFTIHLNQENVVLVISALGYKTITREINFGEASQKQVDFQLTENIEQLEGIVIIDKQSGLTRKTPYALTGITMQDISRQNHSGGIAAAIKDLPGISGAEMGPGIVKPFIRGLGFSRVVTIYQNNKIENHQWGQDHGLGLNSLGVKSVDVIKGPASLLYGSGAIGGVLIIKDDESYLNSANPTGNFGASFNSVSNGYRTFASMGNKFKNNIFLAVDAAYEKHADYKDGNNRIIGNSRFNHHTLRIHTGLDTEKFKNKLSFSYHKQNLAIIDDSEMEETLATTRNDKKMQLPFQEIADYLLSYSQESFREKFSTYLHVSHHFNDRSEIEENFDEIDLGLNQNHTFYSGRISFFPENGFIHTMGLQGSFINTSNKPESEEILIPDATTTDIGVYYLGSRQFNKFYLQGGLRFDYRNVVASTNAPGLIEYGFILPGNPENRKLSTHFSGLTGSIGSSYNLSDNQQIKLNISTGFRAPDLAELFSNGPHPGTSRFEMGSADFEREQSLQTDLSYSYTSAVLDFGASVYANDISNYIFFTNTGEIRPDDGLEIWAFRQQNAFLYGTEAELSYRPLKSLQIKATAALVRGNIKDNEENLTFIPADNYGLQLAFRPNFSTGTQFTVNLNHTSRQDRPGFNELETAGYTLVNSGFSHQFDLEKGVLTTGLQIHNIFNTVYIDHLSILRAFSIPNPGRNTQVAIGYRF